MTSDGLVVIQRIAGVMWEGDQVDSGHVGFNCHVIAALQRGYQPVHDCFASRITDMKNPAPGMSSLLSQQRVALLVLIKLNLGPLFKDLVKQGRTFLSKNASRSRRTYSSASLDDVVHQQIGPIISPATNDASLRVERVRFVWVASAGYYGDLAAGVASKSQRCGCAGDAATNDKNIGSVQRSSSFIS
jgi:hypothetical protein